MVFAADHGRENLRGCGILTSGVPVARAKVSMRIPPAQDATSALAALTAHLAAHVPWGAQVTIKPGEAGQPGSVPTSGPVFEAAAAALAEAWGREPVTAGLGGSIPLVAELHEAFPDATVLVTAVADPACREHGVDESLHLGDWRNAALAEVLLMDRLAH